MVGGGEGVRTQIVQSFIELGVGVVQLILIKLGRVAAVDGDFQFWVKVQGWVIMQTGET